MCEQNEIMLNRLYSGSFLSTGSNIGHEVINFIKADDDKNYIYVVEDGKISKDHSGRIGTILFVTGPRNSVMTVIAKATKLKQIIESDLKDAELHKRQLDYLEINNICYGGKRLDEIYVGNIYHGEPNINAIYITFMAGEIRKAKEQIFIKVGETAGERNGVFYLDIGEGQLARQESRMFFLRETRPNSQCRAKPNSYDVLQKIIEKKDLWEEIDTTAKVDTENYKPLDVFNYLQLIRKEDDELVFSNLLQHFFLANQSAFQAFCQSVLGIDGMTDQYIIEREKKNIDLLITDEKNFIVIENKIKSGIHRSRGDNDSTQLDRYREYAEREAKDRKKSFFMFLPDYNSIDISKFERGNEYKVIKYSQIYKFFWEHKEQYKEEKYFEEFLMALYKHTKATDTSNFEIMYARFCESTKRIDSEP